MRNPSRNDADTENFVNGRVSIRAYNVRQQLRTICVISNEKGGLGLNVEQSCDQLDDNGDH